MWLFTKLGFYSVVRHRERPGIRIVRARLKEDAQRMSELLDQHGLRHQFLITPDADYRYRLVMDDLVWERAAQLLAADIDYPNFKAEIRQQEDKARDRAYGDIWWRMMQLQEAQAS